MPASARTVKRDERPRRVRLPVSGVTIQLGHHHGELVNLSVTGALFVLDAPLPLESEWRLPFRGTYQTLTVTGRVTWMRRLVRQSESGGIEVRYKIAVAFLDQSVSAQRLLRQFYVESAASKTG
jgi:hypothetical protein